VTALLIVLSVLAFASGLGVVMARSPIYSALSLVLTIGMLAIIFLALTAQFLFAVQLIIYAGAVVVLFIFIIALLNPGSEDRPVVDARAIVGVVGVLGITALFTVLAMNGTTFSNAGFHGALAGASANPYHSFAYTPCAVNGGSAGCTNALGGNTQTVAGQLFTTYLMPFEITSLVLLVAAIAAVYLTRRTTVPRLQ
jgi:NADH-quinone oxidoreductase subunit J